MPEIEYPNVRCKEPAHADEPGYIVCTHVQAGATVAHVMRATKQEMGEVLCSRFEHTAEDFILACATCCRRKGWIPIA